MYRLIRFGLISLEHYNQVDVVGSGSTPTSYYPLPEGGAWDNFGSQQKHVGMVERVSSRRLRGSTAAATEQLYFELLAQRGTRNRLYRQTKAGNIHWQFARLVEVTAQRSYEQTKFGDGIIQDIDLRFITQETFWRGSLGGAWYFDSGEYFDSGLSFDSAQSFDLISSPTEITLTTSDDIGRATTRALRINIEAGSSAITSITIARTGGESITFSGTIASGDTLIIDTGTMQVTNDGNDAYDDLTLSPTADLAAWFSLVAGDNEITITYTGGGTGSTIDFSYYEAWF